jgi:hypothetical protein
MRAPNGESFDYVAAELRGFLQEVGDYLPALELQSVMGLYIL